jgi:predicted esterase
VEQHHFLTQRTARYFTLGTCSKQTSEIWFVLHGYAQLASDFIQPFNALNNGNRFIIAPEGLNRFYAKGLRGKPAATWMTSEDRENEIRDYLNYLDGLYDRLVPGSFTGKIYLLGFSQGTATASRWAHSSNKVFHKLVIYAGEIAAELREPLSEKLKRYEVVYITGKDDPLIRKEDHQRVYETMKRLNARIIEFKGGHEIREDVLRLMV